MTSGITLHVPLDEIESIARPACLACTDFANEYADIAVGGLGSPDGFTTVLLRTIGGKRVYTDAVHRGYVEVRASRDRETERAEKARMLGLVESFTARKRARGERRARELKA
jgi:coenzyme F420 hydrogenase subunit beta